MVHFWNTLLKEHQSKRTRTKHYFLNSNPEVLLFQLDLQSQPASKRDVSFTSDLISPTVQQKPATGLDEIGLGLPDLNLPVEAEGVHEVECGMS